MTEEGRFVSENGAADANKSSPKRPELFSTDTIRAGACARRIGVASVSTADGSGADGVVIFIEGA